MDKIAVMVKIPALGSTYEFLVPSTMSIKNALGLMIRILSSEYGISDKCNGVMLFDIDDHTALPFECSFAQLGICDGAQLLMI